MQSISMSVLDYELQLCKLSGEKGGEIIEDSFGY